MMFDVCELNYSKIRAWLDCPFLYRFIYEQRRYPPLSPWASLGMSAHGALARFHQMGPGASFDDLRLCYDLAWNHRGYSTPSETMDFYDKGLELLGDFWRVHSSAPVIPLYSEKIIRFPFEKWRVRGTIDRVDDAGGGTVELIDYKLGVDEAAGAPDPTASLQLSIYAIGLRLDLGLKVSRVTYFLLKGGRRVSAPYDPSGEEETLNTLRRAGEGILSLELSRKGNCRGCSIAALCPESEARPDQPAPSGGRG